MHTITGVDVSAPYNVCRPDLGKKPNVESILKWAQDAGKATGKYLVIQIFL